MAISDALGIADDSSAETKDRARESILNTLAHSAVTSDVSRRRQFAFATVQAALVTVGALVLIVGAAAAAGVDLSSVPRRVVDTLVEPLPLSAASGEHLAVLKPRDGPPSDDSGGSGRDVASAVEEPAVQGQPFALVSGTPKTGGPRVTNPPGHSGSPGQTNPAGNDPRHTSTPQTDPAGRGPQSKANDPPGGGIGQGHQRTQADAPDPPGNTQCHDGQPGGSEQSASNPANTQEGSDEHEQNHSTDNGSNGDRENPPAHELGNGSTEPNISDSGESSPGGAPASDGPR